MDKIEVVRSEVVEPSNEINGLTSPTGEIASLKRKGNFERVPHLKDTRRCLIALRNAHGADTPIGHRCSNLVELLQMPELATGLIQRQMADLERLRRTFQ